MQLKNIQNECMKCNAMPDCISNAEAALKERSEAEQSHNRTLKAKE